jgi:hypothetical protein
VYLGSFRIGLVCKDRVGSSLAVGRAVSLIGIRLVRNALENMPVVVDCAEKAGFKAGLPMRRVIRPDSGPVCVKGMPFVI